MRALEIAHFGQDLENQETLYEPLIICLDDERSQLYERINHRVDLMFEAGLLDEAKWLFDHYPDVQAAKGIGYKELFPYFRGEQSLEEASDRSQASDSPICQAPANLVPQSHAGDLLSDRRIWCTRSYFKPDWGVFKMIETEKKEERVLLIGVELQGMDNLTSPWKSWLVWLRRLVQS